MVTLDSNPLNNAKQPEAVNNRYVLPSSPASNLIYEILAVGKDLGRLYRKEEINSNTRYKIEGKDKQRRITLTSESSEITIEITDIDKLAGSNKSAKKLFVLSLVKANEQILHNGKLGRDYISFPLQELVDIGFYSTLRSARMGFSDGMSILTSLKIKIKSKRKTKVKVIESEELKVLFTEVSRRNGQCFIYFNPRIDWNFFTQYFTILPSYYFSLPNRASDLLLYIFYLARQRTRDIQEKGSFSISLRAVQHRLQLPNEEGCNKPQRDIKDPILEAIEQIETGHKKTYGNKELSLSLVCNEEASMGEYLDNGYLKVELNGGLASYFTDLAQKTEMKIIETEKRQARIQEKAIAIAKAKKLKEK